MQHQQKVAVPEREQILRYAVDVMLFGVPHAQRRMQTANERGAKQRKRSPVELQTIAPSSANWRSYSFR